MARPLVTLDRVDVRRPGATLLEDVSLEVRAGDGLGIVGPSGSGKSTLLRLLRGELWPHPASAGRRLFHDADGASESPIGVRRRFSLVAPEQQDAYVRRDWDLTAEAVVRSGFHDAVYPPEAATPAQTARIAEVARLLGIAPLLPRPMLELSRGEARRVLLARALAPRPELLLLDEATDGLDAASRAGFLDLVSRLLRAGTAVVMATHREEELVPEIGRVVALDAGRIAGTRPPRPPAGGAGHVREAPSRIGAVGAPPIGRPRGTAAPPGPAEGALLFRARGVTVRVEGRDVLRDLDFTLTPGERVAVHGANGAGKSTFLRLLAGEEQPAAGTIERLDLGPRAARAELRGRIGLVSPELQARHRFDATGEEVVLSGFEGTIGLDVAPTEARREAAAAALARLRIAHLAGRRLLSLSYGELRKLLLARALAPTPEVLLLDEPLAGLDPASRAWILSALEEESARGTGLVAVTHHADELPRAVQRRLVLEGGRLRDG